MNTSARHEAANQHKWDRKSGEYANTGNFYHRFIALQKKVLATTKLRKEMRFLDIGCGPGSAVCLASEMVHGQGSFYGIDLSQGMIDKAIKNSQKFENVQFTQASSEKLPFEDGFFDVVICTNSFHHYQHPMVALREIKRTLKKGGKTYILDFTSDNYSTRCLNFISTTFEKEHVKYYNTSEYQMMFNNSGLQYIGTQHLACMMYVLEQKLHIAEKV